MNILTGGGAALTLTRPPQLNNIRLIPAIKNLLY